MCEYRTDGHLVTSALWAMIPKGQCLHSDIISIPYLWQADEGRCAHETGWHRCSGATLNWCLELWPGKAFSISCARGGCYQSGRCCVQTGTLRGMHCWCVGTHRRCVRLGWCMHCWGESSLQQGCAGTPGRHHHELEWSQGCCHLQALDVSSPIFALSPLHKRYTY